MDTPANPVIPYIGSLPNLLPQKTILPPLSEHHPSNILSNGIKKDDRGMEKLQFSHCRTHQC